MTRTSYLPDGAAAQGWSVHPYESRWSPEPATDTGAMAPAGQVWATITDLARYATFLLDGHPDVLSADELERAFGPQSGNPTDGLRYAHGLGFQLLPGGSGHARRAHRLDAGLPRHRAWSTAAGASAASCSPTPPSATRRPRSSPSCSTSSSAASRRSRAPWTPSAGVPAELAGVPGVWHWGNTPIVFTMEADAPGRPAQRRRGSTASRCATAGWSGCSGYHAGEELHVVRRADGSVGHLDIATFIYTRTPYDPEAPIPGGPPDR